MDDLEFRQRALANPSDQSEDFLQAIEEKPERKALLAEIKQFDRSLHSLFLNTKPPQELEARLLKPESLARTLLGSHPSANGVPHRAAMLRRLMPLAASLLIAFGLLFAYWPTDKRLLERDVLAHIYQEMDYLDSGRQFSRPTVNRVLARYGAEFKADHDIDAMQVKMVKDCLVARQISLHMAMEGKTGMINVFLLAAPKVEKEFEISDKRFTGVVTPTPGGNLIVVGEKSEPVLDQRNLIAGNINWVL